MKKMINSCASMVMIVVETVMCTVSAFAETEISLSNDTVTYTIPVGEKFTLNEEFPQSAQTVVVTGGGTLEVAVANKRKDMVIDVQKGYLKTALNQKPFGTNSLVKISNGGALWFTGPNINENLYNTIFDKVEISGAGPDGLGAFYRTGYSGPDYAIGILDVKSGATLGGDKRYGARITYLNGNTLTNAISDVYQPFMYRYFGSWFWFVTEVVGPGNIVQKSKSVVIQNCGNSFWKDLDSSNTWSLEDGGLLNLSEASYFPFSLEVASGTPTITISGASVTMSGSIIGKDYNKTTFTAPNNSELHKLAIGGDVTNLRVTVACTNLAISMKDSNFYGSLSSLGGSTMNVVGGKSHKIIGSYSIARLNKGSHLSFTDAGTIWMPNALIDCGNANFVDNQLISTFEIAGNTCMALTSTAFPAPGIFVGASFSDNSVGTIQGGWGTMTIRDGASVTNSMHIGSSGVGALYLNDSTFFSQGRNMVVGFGDSSYGYMSVSNGTVVHTYRVTIAGAGNSVGHYVQHGGRISHKSSALILGSKGVANFYIGNGGWYDTASTYKDTTGASFLSLGDSEGTLTGGESVLTCDNCSTCEVSRIYTLPCSNYRSQINLNRGGCLAWSQMWYSKNTVRGEDSRLLFSLNGGILKYRLPWEKQENFLGGMPDRIIIHSHGGEIVVPTNNWFTCSAPIEGVCKKSVSAVYPPTDPEFIAATNIGPARIEFEGSGEGATAFIAFDKDRGTLGDVIITSPGSGYDDNTMAYVTIPQYPNRRFVCSVELAEETGGDFIKSGEGQLTLTRTNSYAGATVVRGGTLVISSDWGVPSNSVLRLEGGKFHCNQKLVYLECVEGTAGNVVGVAGKTLNVNRLSLAGTDGIEFSADMTMCVNGSWKVRSSDLVALKAQGKVPSYSCVVKFAEGSTIEFDGTDGLSMENAPYPICKFESQKRVGLPALVNGESLGERWRLSMSGDVLMLKYRRPFAVIFR